MKVIKNDKLIVIEILDNYIKLQNERTKQEVIIENQI